MLPPVKLGSKLDKKGFCKDFLTKETCFGQETLTMLCQGILTNIVFEYSSLVVCVVRWVYEGERVEVRILVCV